MGSGSSRTRKVDVQTQFPRRIQSASITPRTRTPSPTSEHM